MKKEETSDVDMDAVYKELEKEDCDFSYLEELFGDSDPLDYF